MIKTTKYLNNFLFFILLIIGHTLALNGKFISGWILNNASTIMSPHFNSTWINIITASSVLFIVFIRISRMSLIFKILSSMTICTLSSFSIQVLAKSPSFLVFWIQIFLWATVVIVIAIEPIFGNKMDKEFWKLVFDYFFRLIRYFMVVYIAGVAVLKYISTEDKESTMGFLATLFYPTLIMLICFFFIGFWILIPCWNKLVLNYKKE